ncbi:MAG: DUF2066 domain-containing protein [Proteobacteria bacterium]|nr:DUF2066 domain-containing protein [Pseudomonadota bacterium]
MRHTLILAALAFLALAPVSAGQAAAPSDPFTVTNIPVDATAASAVEAQTIAINSGKARAWQMVLKRLLKPEDIAKVPALDDVALTRLIASYLPQDVRRSTTRYVAKMTYAFNPAAVRHLLRGANIAYSDAQGHPILILALSPKWAGRSPWAAAWATPLYSHAALPLVLPYGDPIDQGNLADTNFDTTTWQDVEPSASRVKAEEAVIAQINVSGGQTIIKMKRLGLGTSPPIPDVTVPGTPPGNLRAAAAATAAAITAYWKTRTAIDFSKRNRLTAEFTIDSLTAWGTLLAHLGTIPTLTDVAVNAMDTGMARLSLTYVGTADQLRDSLAQQKVDLTQKAAGGSYTLALQDPDPTSATAGQ